ncbi:MAG: L-seryl-tRNA(Sec) selenium transferase [bacterium]
MLESLPGIDRVLLLPEVSELCRAYSREQVVEWARQAVAELKEELLSGEELPLSDDGKLEDELVAAGVIEQMQKSTGPSLRRVVNATGIVIHTNLGRSPLSTDLTRSISDMMGTYSNLEYDLEEGKRGSRHDHLQRLIPLVTGAEQGFVVNNNAAAVLVSLSTLAAGKEVIVSRGELIEIGGSFRMPEIIESGGARIREVGTTNKTRLADYEKAITSETALILKVHPSNYKLEGFTEEAELADLVRLGEDADIPVMMDLGSGLLIDLEKYGIEAEKPARWYMKAGPHIVTFSADKLLGGPQAGFIVGRSKYIQRIQKNPMVRALRVGKLTISALETMLTTYLTPRPEKKIPALSMLVQKPDAIRRRARKIASRINELWPAATAKVEKDHAYAGGGSLPGEQIATFVVALEVPGMDAAELAARFRQAEVPVIGRIKSGRFCLDFRSLRAEDDRLITDAIREIKRSE